jgi:K+/H+ antiporter YhaU regulatory subunit KhtT
MDDQLLPRAEVHVREHPLPGNSRLFWLTLADGSVIGVASHSVGTGREVSLTLPGQDEPALTTRLSDVEATTLAALLSGVRFLVETPADHAPVGGANLRTLTIGAGSPAIGVKVADIDVPSPGDARVIAVIRDDTPELVEEDPRRPCQPGDRLVLVGRPEAMRELVQHLLG